MTYTEIADSLLVSASVACAIVIAWILHRQAVRRAYADGFFAGKRAAIEDRREGI